MPDIPLEQPFSPSFVADQLRQAGLWRAAWRALQLLRVALDGMMWRLIDGIAAARHGDQGRRQRQERRARWLLDRIVWLGPAFVKVGQAIATRPDLLPLAYIDVLSTLHDQLPPFDNAVAIGVIEEELGWKVETLFDQFDPQPFAAASLGQVYRAVSHEGRPIAVKVQRPDLMSIVSRDLALLRRFAGLAERWRRLGRGIAWVSIVDEFGAKLFEELDYVHEAHLTERFRRNIAGLPGVYAPRVFWELTSRRVLCTELIEGVKVTDRQALADAGVDVRSVVAHGLRANLKQLFEDGLFHADPHPGNLLVRPGDGTLVFIDFGMMGIIRPEQKERILEIFVDVINRRPENLRDNLIALGCLRPDSRWEELLPLANAMFQALFGDSEGRHTFRDVTRSFAPLVYKYEFRIPADLATIVRAIMMLEGISRQLDPSFDIFAVSAPYAARLMLTHPNPGLRRRLMAELLTADGALDWPRLQQILALATRQSGFRLEPEGLARPALDMLLSPEGEDLRRALVDELLQGSTGIQPFAALLSADPSFSGRAILDRLVAFLLSPEGASTREQLAHGLGSGSSQGHRISLARAVELASLAGTLHPDFRLSNLISALGGFLLSHEGRPVRNRWLAAGAQRLLGGLADRLNRLSAPEQPAVLPAAPGPGG